MVSMNRRKGLQQEKHLSVYMCASDYCFKTDLLFLTVVYTICDSLKRLSHVFSVERKRQKTVKYHIMRRQMTASGAPQRKLTWEAIKQIR